MQNMSKLQDMKLKVILAVIVAGAMAFSCTTPDIKDNPAAEDQEQKMPDDPEPTPAPEPEPDYSGILPKLLIETPGRLDVLHKSTWVEGATIWSVSPSDDTTKLGTIKIKLRGNSTRSYPKKPYNIKFDSKVPLLGMTKGKKWCLLANWMDRTLLRNDTAFELARRSPGLAWTPDGRFAEVVLNGQELGNYYVCEKITISGSRVDVSEPGGFIIELDTYFDEVNKFHSSALNMPVNIKEPDEDDILPGDFERLQSAYETAEAAVMKAGGDTTFRKLIDIDSFVDWWIVMELSGNGEAGHPKSSYMYCDSDMVFHAGPAWDFDWGTFIPNMNYFTCKGCIWYPYLFRDSLFVERVKFKWAAQKADYAGVLEHIDSISDEIENSAIADCAKWPIDQDVNHDETLGWRSAVSRLRSALDYRISWLDGQIEDL